MENDKIGGQNKDVGSRQLQLMDAVRLFGRNVRELRRVRGLSQEALALEAGMKRSYVSEVERGTRNPTVRALGRLAEALGVPPARLLETPPRQRSV